MTRYWHRRLRGLACGLVLASAAPLCADELPEVGPPSLASPAVLEPGDAAPLVGPGEGHVETIQERYPNRQVKVERQVLQCEDGSYVNHGPWTMWDSEGRMMGRGEYQHGRREGKWTRWFKAGEGDLFAGEAYQRFEAPFVSQATFRNDELHGPWVIVDAQKREVCAWEFEHGQRHGRCVWWHPEGTKWREVSYVGGILDGEALEWNAAGELVRKERFERGRRLGTEVEYYSSGAKKFEAQVLYGRPVVETSDDFWSGSTKVTVVGTEGADVRHGTFIGYNRNGEKVLEGQYDRDLPAGRFTWYFDNGQRAIEGGYDLGEPDGVWTWWHPNGQKQLEGTYRLGEQVGRWVWWKPEGQVAASAIYDVRPAEALSSPVPADGSLPLLTEAPEELDTSAPPPEAFIAEGSRWRTARPGLTVEATTPPAQPAEGKSAPAAKPTTGTKPAASGKSAAPPAPFAPPPLAPSPTGAQDAGPAALDATEVPGAAEFLEAPQPIKRLPARK